jgi:signal transduction histidine kinase
MPETARAVGPGRGRRSASVSWQDAALAAGVLVVQVGATYAAAHHQHVHHRWDAGAVALLAAGPIALVWRRPHPVAVLWVALSSALAYWVIGYGRGPLFLALIIALLTAVTAGHRAAGIASLLVGYAAFLWLGPTIGRGSWPPLLNATGLAAWLLVLLAAGEALRARRRRATERAQLREAESRQRASEERLMIARELHDILAHNISVINVQAGTALHRARRSEARAYDALALIKQVSQDTLVELRSLLATLRDVDDVAPRGPAPTLARLDDLVATAAAAGVAARVERCGPASELPASVDVAAYRIVQEALTNVARHAGTDRADVRVVYGDDDVVVQVDDDGRAREPVVRGTGLTGMAERAAALGGHFHAGPLPAGGFRVRAWLPLRRPT